MKTTYKIHPAIGIARVGNSPEQFYLAPEKTGALPIACDSQGNAIEQNGVEQTTTQMKDNEGRILRQGARFQIFVYDDANPEGRPLKIGDTIQGLDGSGKLLDIHWSVYLANKKASWYEFRELEGEHGYDTNHPLRNASITDDARSSLIIDPGVQTVSVRDHRHAEFARGENPGQAQTFPPPLVPNSIDTLGEMRTDDRGRLIVLGGHGNSGTFLEGLGNPAITNFANNDGWFDDVSDGPVTAVLEYYNEQNQNNAWAAVDEAAWILVGNPGYAPNIINIITLDDTLYDLFVRKFAYNTDLYGTDFSRRVQVDATNPADLTSWRNGAKRWNPNYYPYFYRDIWPILLRPYNAQWVTDFLGISHAAHEIGPRGDFDESKVSQPPAHGDDPYRSLRMFVYDALRKPGQDNSFQNASALPDNRIYGKPLMPLLCGDNPLSNTLPAKFLTMTPTQIFLLHQWAIGKFINEKNEGISEDQIEPTRQKGVEIDRGVLSNALGGSFCPGGEIGWIIRNPAIYSKPYRINWNSSFLPRAGSGRIVPAEFFPPQLSLTEDFEAGLEPGDLTKRSALPWQADFNECSTQAIDVTYRNWCELFDDGRNDPALKPKNRKVVITLWWPAHRPMQVYKLKGPAAIYPPDKPGSYKQVDWATGIPQTAAGDLKMVTAWADLGFVLENPSAAPTNGVPPYTEVD